MDGLELVNGDFGLRAVIKTAWSDEMTSFLLDRPVTDFELNDGKGWRGNNLEFLVHFPHLVAFTIIDLKISSIEPIHFLPRLQKLEVITYCKSEIRFSQFPRLTVCELEWRPQAISLFHCTMLKDLYINSYSGRNCDPFAQLVNLESLAILNAQVEDLYGLSALENLRSLRLANLKRLCSLAGIERLIDIEELEIHTCPIHSILEIANLTRLRKLRLNNLGELESLKPISKLSGLESVLFYESTNIADGNLAPLLDLKNLSCVSFRNRRHYSHRREEITQRIEGRHEEIQ